ncbi:hypothetical protein HPA02_12520 [Bisbaumannia pacifica]|uniref:Uncharacterized protein n=1 Tax=Bisbaumannia pacifica TaxID=77098 RepID=A0A510X6C4_9GAMM|nr:hypothetical protein HPA02_12520 [Halomonas pacifica]
MMNAVASHGVPLGADEISGTGALYHMGMQVEFGIEVIIGGARETGSYSAAQ